MNNADDEAAAVERARLRRKAADRPGEMDSKMREMGNEESAAAFIPIIRDFIDWLLS